MVKPLAIWITLSGNPIEADELTETICEKAAMGQGNNAAECRQSRNNHGSYNRSSQRKTSLDYTRDVLGSTTNEQRLMGAQA